MTHTTRDDLSLIQSFASGDPAVAQKARFRDWFGWRPSTAVTCPRALAGKHCRQYDHGDNTCVCVRLHHPLLDHPRRWLDRDGRPVLTAEPYNFPGEDFAELATECAALGLNVTVHGLSPYFPGRAILIVIRKTGDEPTREEETPQ
jgi:hypothetical protein